MRVRALVVGALTLASALGTVATANAAMPDLQILSVDHEPATVPVGVATTVTWTVNIRDNLDPTTGTSGSAGPVPGDPAFSVANIQVQNEGQEPDEPMLCDQPAPAARCHMYFANRGQTQILTLTDTVTPTAPGTLTREFTADVTAPDTEGNGSNNRLSGSIEAVPDDGFTPVVSKASFTRGGLTAKQKKVDVGTMRYTINQPANLLVVVSKQRKNGQYRYWGEFNYVATKAGANSQHVANRIDRRQDPLQTFKLNRMNKGRYKAKVVADDGTYKSKPVMFSFSLPSR